MGWLLVPCAFVCPPFAKPDPVQINLVLILQSLTALSILRSHIWEDILRQFMCQKKNEIGQSNCCFHYWFVQWKMPLDAPKAKDAWNLHIQTGTREYFSLSFIKVLTKFMNPATSILPNANMVCCSFLTRNDFLLVAEWPSDLWSAVSFTKHRHSLGLQWNALLTRYWGKLWDTGSNPSQLADSFTFLYNNLHLKTPIKVELEGNECRTFKRTNEGVLLFMSFTLLNVISVVTETLI